MSLASSRTCFLFSQSGSCRYGARCRFEHVMDGSVPSTRARNRVDKGVCSSMNHYLRLSALEGGSVLLQTQETTWMNFLQTIQHSFTTDPDLRRTSSIECATFSIGIGMMRRGTRRIRFSRMPSRNNLTGSMELMSTMSKIGKVYARL